MTEEEKLILSVKNKKDAKRVGKKLGIKWRMVYYRRAKLLKQQTQPAQQTNSSAYTYLYKKLKKHKQAGLNDVLSKFSAVEVTEAIDQMRTNGLIISVIGDTVFLNRKIDYSPPTTINIGEFNNGWIKFGVVSDTHLNSKYERMDVLNSLYDIFEGENIHTVLHAGNIIDGYSRLNQFDVFNVGTDDQINYCVTAYPQREGITTHFITADDHEGWIVQREHINVGQVIEDVAERAGRHDLHHLGYIEADVKVKVGQRPTIIRIMHPSGGASYATSYQAQKIIESMHGGEKPDFLIIGHYHKQLSGMVRNVPYILAGTTEDQTTFMRKKHLAAHIGGWIVQLHIAKGGYVNRVKTEWINYFNRDFYLQKPQPARGDAHLREWKYQW